MLVINFIYQVSASGSVHASWCMLCVPLEVFNTCTDVFSDDLSRW